MGVEFSDRPLANQWKHMGAQPAQLPPELFDMLLQGDSFKEKTPH